MNEHPVDSKEGVIGFMMAMVAIVGGMVALSGFIIIALVSGERYVVPILSQVVSHIGPWFHGLDGLLKGVVVSLCGMVLVGIVYPYLRGGTA